MFALPASVAYQHHTSASQALALDRAGNLGKQEGRGCLCCKIEATCGLFHLRLRALHSECRYVLPPSPRPSIPDIFETTSGCKFRADLICQHRLQRCWRCKSLQGWGRPGPKPCLRLLPCLLTAQLGTCWKFWSLFRSVCELVFAHTAVLRLQHA